MKNLWSKAQGRLEVLKQPGQLKDWILFFQIFMFAAIVPVLMRLKLSSLEALLEPKRLPLDPDQDGIQRTIDLVDAAIRLGRPLVRPGCLTRGVTAYYFLRRAGVDVKLCFGIGNERDDFAGHCWLVQDGRPLFEKSDPQQHFISVYRFNGSKQLSEIPGENQR